MEELDRWFEQSRRDLPWRTAPRDPWAVLVSEVMLQQTPVARVLPAWEAWLDRWPDPTALATDQPGEAVIMWDRLGYPRRALRLHAAAVRMRDNFDGRVPDTYEDLISLPGIGDYTAAAIIAFAYRRRVPVLDTNVRRVLARYRHGFAHPRGSAVTRIEREELATLLPSADEKAATTSEALMELGALVCTSRAPHCGECPLIADCSWSLAGSPANRPPPNRQARFAGSDREVRGRIMQLLRSTPGGVSQAELDVTWHDERQLARAQASLIVDGLLVETPDNRFTLPVT